MARLKKFIRAPWLIAKSSLSLRRAQRQGDESLQFGTFARQIGWRLFFCGKRNAFPYLINPVVAVRYYEFAFARRCLPETPGQWLDISSPSLFSLYAAHRHPQASIAMINPDEPDIKASRQVCRALGIANVETFYAGADWIETCGRTFDCIWSISVIEHIAGAYEDDKAVKMMFDALKPGGRLILTFPVDRTAWDEYRERYFYHSPTQKQGEKYFFCRLYDPPAIRKRIIESIGVEPTRIEWFGERAQGLHTINDTATQKLEWEHSYADAEHYLRDYRRFSSWEEMAGMGICGMMFEKKT